MPFLTTFAWGFAAMVGVMTILWLVSVWRGDASIVDPFWGTGFILLAFFYAFLTDGPVPRRWLILILVTAWGLRLSLYLLWRNWGQGEDYRYRQFRQNAGPERYWWVSFFQVFLLQGTLLWLVSAPLLGALTTPGYPELRWLDYLGLGVWIIGFIFEAGADWQLARFKADPRNQGKLLTDGLWRYTRHPNYFGDAAVWWGFGLISLSAGAPWAALGALLMTFLLLRVSGVALLERSLKKKKPGYEAYSRRTSAFFPWPPKEE